MSELLPLPAFDLLHPESVEECIALLQEHPDAKIIAGGTDLLPSMKYGLFEPPTLISTKKIASLQELGTEDGGLQIGASLTHRELQQSSAVSERLPVLAEVCSQIATPTLQAMGTLGGNIMLDTRCIWYNQSDLWRTALGGCLKCEGSVCHVAPKGTGCYAAHSADTIPVLLLAKAEVEFAGPGGLRRIPLRELYHSDGLVGTHTQPTELLTRILVPAPEGTIAYRKLRVRASIDYPLLLTAVRVDRDAAGTCTGGAVALSSIGPRPLLLEDELSDLIRSGDITAAAEAAYKIAMPLSTHNTSSLWRKKMVRVEVKRALSQAIG